MDRLEFLDLMRRNAEALYDRFASRYWTVWTMEIPETHGRFMQRFLEQVPAGGLVLSAACGAGRFDGLLLEAGCHVIATDQSEVELVLARQHFPAADYRKMTLQELNFREVFDGVICMDAMEHIPPEDYPVILRNFQQALKPGRFLYFTADREDEPDFDLQEAFEQGQALGLPIRYGEVADVEAFERAMTQAEVSDELTDRGVYHYYPPLAQVRAWIEQAGLVIVEEAEGDGFTHFLARK